MNTKLLHNSFNAGEISPELLGRPDLQQFRFGAARLFNWISKTSGAAQLRPGFETIAPLDSRARLIPFKDDGDDYLVALSAGSFRLFRNGVPISVNGGFDDVFVVGDQATSGNIDVVNDVIYTQRPHNFTDLEELRVISTGGTGEPGGLNSTTIYEARPAGPYGLQFKRLTDDPVDITSLNTGTLAVWREAGLPEDYRPSIPLVSVTTRTGGGPSGYGHASSSVVLATPHGWPVGTRWRWNTTGGGVAPPVVSPNGYVDPYYGQEFTVVPDDPGSALGFPLSSSAFEASRVVVAGSTSYTVSVSAPGTPAFTPPVSAERYYPAGFMCFLRSALGPFPSGSFIRAKAGVWGVAVPSAADWELVPAPWLELPNNYTAAELNEVTYAQTAGKIRFAHRNHPTLELYLTELGQWSYRTPLAADASLSTPTVTPFRGAQIQVQSAAVGTFGSITLVGDTGLGAGDLVYASGTPSTTGVADGFYVVGLVAAGGRTIQELFDLSGALATSSLSTFGGGTLTVAESTADSLARYIITAVDERGREYARSAPSASTFNLLRNAEAYNTVGWTPSAGAAAYRIYKEVDGTELFGFVAEAGAPPFLDRNVDPDYATQAPSIDSELQLDYPGAVGFYDQRGVFGGNTAKPQGLWFSSLGRDSELVTRRAQLDTDRIALEIAAKEGQSVRHIVPVSELLILTNSATWSLSTQNTDALTPTSAKLRLQTTVGANRVTPLVMDNSVLYVSGGNHVYRLGYQLTENSFGGANQSTRAAHIFDNVNLVDSATTKSRLPAAWYTTDTGRLLGLTYAEEEQVSGWHQHELGHYSVRSVAAVQEGAEDRLYVTLEHRSTGAWFLARLQSTNISSPISSAHLDMCHVRNTLRADPASLTVKGSLRVGGEMRVASTRLSFDFNMVGEVLYFPDTGLRMQITSRETASQVTCRVTNVGSAVVGVFSNWGVTVTRLRNLTALSQHERVTALLEAVDGTIGFATLSVASDGKVVLPYPCRTVHIGDLYFNELRTMPVTAQMEAAGLGRVKAISHAYTRIYETAGLQVGPDMSHLSDMFPGDFSLRSEEARELIEQTWSRDGQVSFNQPRPLPATVCSVTLDVSFGG